MKRDNERKSHPVTLGSKTHERLERYKAKLIGELGTTKVTYDDVINALLDFVKAK